MYLRPWKSQEALWEPWTCQRGLGAWKAPPGPAPILRQSPRPRGQSWGCGQAGWEPIFKLPMSRERWLKSLGLAPRSLCHSSEANKSISELQGITGFTHPKQIEEDQNLTPQRPRSKKKDSTGQGHLDLGRQQAFQEGFPVWSVDLLGLTVPGQPKRYLPLLSISACRRIWVKAPPWFLLVLKAQGWSQPVLTVGGMPAEGM